MIPNRRLLKKMEQLQRERLLEKADSQAELIDRQLERLERAAKLYRHRLEGKPSERE